MNTIRSKENISPERYQMAVRVLEAIGLDIEKVTKKKKKKNINCLKTL